jgi:hypothetical protein
VGGVSATFSLLGIFLQVRTRCLTQDVMCCLLRLCMNLAWRGVLEPHVRSDKPVAISVLPQSFCSNVPAIKLLWYTYVRPDTL